MYTIIYGVCRNFRMCAIIASIFLSRLTLADGLVVDKVYDPYVQPLETEIEFRFISQNDNPLPDIRKAFLGFGRSLSERWSVELYAIGLEDAGENISIDTYEIEAKWQLTEQGEYAFDWGMLFEVERDVEENAWEIAVSLLSSRDFGRWTAIANLGVLYESGRVIDDELETVLHVQTRFRYKETFEPAIELHMGQDTAVLGPAVTGLWRISRGKKLRWELGIFAGISNQSPEQTVKANFEFEF